MIRQFAFHDNVPTSPPNCDMFNFYNKLEKGEQLTKEEQKTVMNSLYGTFGQNGTRYKKGGWEANFAPLLKRILVNEKHIGWKEYRSFNKTMLREVLGTHNCLEMVELPIK